MKTRSEITLKYWKRLLKAMIAQQKELGLVK